MRGRGAVVVVHGGTEGAVRDEAKHRRCCYASVEGGVGDDVTRARDRRMWKVG